MMARRLGNDTLFVLAYSTIQLNTDAWNPGCPGPLGAFSRLSIFHGESVFSMALLCVRAGRLTRTRRFPARAVQKRMSQRDFIDNNRRSPDLVNLTEAYLNEVYAEIQIAEIKIKDESKRLDQDQALLTACTAESFNPPISTIVPGGMHWPS